MSTRIKDVGTWTLRQSFDAKKTEMHTRDLCVECWTANTGGVRSARKFRKEQTQKRGRHGSPASWGLLGRDGDARNTGTFREHEGTWRNRRCWKRTGLCCVWRCTNQLVKTSGPTYTKVLKSVCKQICVKKAGQNIAGLGKVAWRKTEMQLFFSARKDAPHFRPSWIERGSQNRAGAAISVNSK